MFLLRFERKLDQGEVRLSLLGKTQNNDFVGLDLLVQYLSQFFIYFILNIFEYTKTYKSFYF